MSLRIGITGGKWFNGAVNNNKTQKAGTKNTMEDSDKIDSLKTLTPFETTFNIEEYIPYCVLRTQLWMHRAINYENLPSVKAIASISTTEARVLMLIVKQQGITPSKIADTIGFDRAIVTRAMTTLVKKDLVYTETIKENQRSKRIYLTSHGADLCKELISVFERFSAHLDSALEPQERETLTAVLEKLLKASQTYIP